MDNQIKTTSQDQDDVFHHVELNLDEYPIKNVLNILLQDKTTGKNIIWATSSYQDRGEIYTDRYEITKEAILGENKILIQPRAFKDLEDQQERTKSRAEVFTPSWIVNKMINQIDNEWFGKENVFNYEIDQSWNSNKAQKIFKTKKEAEQYIQRRVLEITCGEAPFLTSRYDASTGQIIPLQDRIGLIDRKMKAVQEKWTNKDWMAKARKAYKSTYGYEFQGDNLLIARINLLLTFVENYEYQFGKRPDQKILDEIADIIAWNIFQMDGLTYCVPLGEPRQTQEQVSLFSLFKQKEESFLCLFQTWKDSKNPTIVKSLSDKKRNDKMAKFDFVIGNPPYQIQDNGNGKSAKPVYNLFVENVKSLQPEAFSFIMPARWYTGGKGLEKFRKEMLSDSHIKKLIDYENYKDVFPGLGGLAGGVCYFIWKLDYTGSCQVVNETQSQANELTRPLNEFPVFIRQNRALEIVRKINEKTKTLPKLNDRISSRKPYGLPTNYKPHEDGVPCWFSQRIGLSFADPSDIDDSNKYLNKWNFLIPRAPIAGQTDFSKPVGFYYDGNTRIAKPGEACTETYLVAGAFPTLEETKNFKSYIFTKIVRFLLLQTVVSQDVTKNNFAFVPDLINYNYEYTDEYLKNLWDLTDEEWNYIDSRIHNYGSKEE